MCSTGPVRGNQRKIPQLKEHQQPTKPKKTIEKKEKVEYHIILSSLDNLTAQQFMENASQGNINCVKI